MLTKSGEGRRTAILAIAVAASGCTTTLTSPLVRPVAFIGRAQAVTLLLSARGQPDGGCTLDSKGVARARARLDGEAGGVRLDTITISNSCGCEVSQFHVTHWIQGPVSKPVDVELRFAAGEWCTLQTPTEPSDTLVVWRGSADPAMFTLHELHSGAFFFAPGIAETELAGIALETLLVDEPVGSLQASEWLDASTEEARRERGICKRGRRYSQCRSVPLDAFVHALVSAQRDQAHDGR